MGEQAEMVLNGDICELCGIYFKEGHSYPVVCEECWDDLSLMEKQTHHKAIYDIY
jgi:hypothetical protein